MQPSCLALYDGDLCEVTTPQTQLRKTLLPSGDILNVKLVIS